MISSIADIYIDDSPGEILITTNRKNRISENLKKIAGFSAIEIDQRWELGVERDTAPTVGAVAVMVFKYSSVDKSRLGA